MMNERYIYLLNEIIHVPSILEVDDTMLLVDEVLLAACFSGQHAGFLDPFNLIGRITTSAAMGICIN